MPPSSTLRTIFKIKNSIREKKSLFKLTLFFCEDIFYYFLSFFSLLRKINNENYIRFTLYITLVDILSLFLKCDVSIEERVLIESKLMESYNAIYHDMNGSRYNKDND